jgi:hypothetical protein
MAVHALRGYALATMSLITLASCARPPAHARAPAASSSERVAFGELSATPLARAGDAFVRAWSDGRAEMSGYRAAMPRYGQMRLGEITLIYVTEPMDRFTRIKDDDAPDARRVTVLKLNESIRFQTGVYPYSILTSVFAPIDRIGIEPFAPAKIVLTAQEWCGSVYVGLWPEHDGYVEQVQSYFASEGEVRDRVDAPAETLYEDALLIQLRELDGLFASGHDWRGMMVPSLWHNRREHRALRPVAATIARADAAIDAQPVHRFTLRYGDYTREIDVEVAPPHRVIGWRASDGEDARLLRTARLPYWQLNHNGDEMQREAFGESGETIEVPDAAVGTSRVGF